MQEILTLIFIGGILYRQSKVPIRKGISGRLDEVWLFAIAIILLAVFLYHQIEMK